MKLLFSKRFMFWMCWFRPHFWKYKGPETQEIWCSRCHLEWRPTEEDHAKSTT